MPEVQSQAQQFDFYKYLRVLWRRKWLLIIPLAICVPFSLWLAYIYPTEYESRAVLELRDNRPVGEERPLRIDVSRELEAVRMTMLSWNAVREVILSRKVEFPVEVDPDDRRQIERIYHKIAKGTRMSARGARHLIVTYRSRYPELNYTLINELVKKFVGEDREEAQDKARKDLKYYSEKLAVAKARLGEIDSQIREFHSANPWLTDTLPELQKQYEDAQERELAVRQELKECQAQIEEVEKELKKEKPEIHITRKVEPSEEVRAAREGYAEAERYFKAMKSRYTPAHRDYQKAARMFAEAEANLKEVDQGEQTIEETVPNPKYEELASRLEQLKKKAERLQQRQLLENKKVSELYVKVRRAPELLAQKRALQEDRAAAAATVEDYTKGARAADKKLQRLMTEAYSTRYVVREYARDDRTPVKSTQTKIVALGVLLGLLVGVGLVALIEYLDQTFKTIDDARAYLGIPALGIVPAIYTPRDHRRRLWFRVLAASSAVFVVGVAVAIYVMIPSVHEFFRNTAWVKFKEFVGYSQW
ncbi:MAG: Wzz/FepE/Etk N-terminal domain-containing protein [Candidatus Brocadiia bacterium]